jgi:DNA-binding GntR family transcriptional regulator
LASSSRSRSRQQTLQQLAYQEIRTAILSGEMESGQRLVETQLAQQFQVSRTPIREAIGLLEHENLAQIDENGVLRVAKISATGAGQLYDCRLALEKLAVEGAAKNATPEQLQEFHHLLAQSSGNPWLVSLLEQVFDKMLLLRIQTMKRNPQVLEVRVEHRRIYDAIAKHDPIEAIDAIAEHLTAAKVRVVNEVYQIDLVELT